MSIDNHHHEDNQFHHKIQENAKKHKAILCLRNEHEDTIEI